MFVGEGITGAGDPGLEAPLMVFLASDPTMPRRSGETLSPGDPTDSPVHAREKHYEAETDLNTRHVGGG